MYSITKKYHNRKDGISNQTTTAQSDSLDNWTHLQFVQSLAEFSVIGLSVAKQNTWLQQGFIYRL